jgi:hypothetical protein
MKITIKIKIKIKINIRMLLIMQNDHKNAMKACSTTEKDNVNDKSNYVTPNDNTYVAQPKTVEKVAINSAKSNKSQQQVNTPQFLKTLEIMRSR